MLAAQLLKKLPPEVMMLGRERIRNQDLSKPARYLDTILCVFRQVSEFGDNKCKATN